MLCTLWAWAYYGHRYAGIFTHQGDDIIELLPPMNRKHALIQSIRGILIYIIQLVGIIFVVFKNSQSYSLKQKMAVCCSDTQGRDGVSY